MGLAYGKIDLPAESNRDQESSQQEIHGEHKAQSGTDTCTRPCNVAVSCGGPSANESSCSDGDVTALAMPTAEARQQPASCGHAEGSVGTSESGQRPSKCKRARKMLRRPGKRRARVITENVFDDPLEQQNVLRPSHSVYFDALDVQEQEESLEQMTRRNAADAGELFHCNICMERKPISESFYVRPCLHIYCTGCMSRYVASKVEQNETSIRCPEPGCRGGILETEACRPILKEAVYQRWIASLCELAVGTDGVYCPYRDCSALLIDDGSSGGGVTLAECPHCHRAFCARCKVPWHGGIGCSAFQALPEGERAREDLMLRELAANSRWQRCPQCKIFVERTEGCVFITCRCGHCFCYGCASQMSGESHFCKNCKRTW